MNDVIQYERDFVIRTKTHHQTPIVHSTSIIAASGSSSCKDEKAVASRSHSRHSSIDHTSTKARTKRLSVKHMHDPVQENASASAMCDSESSLSAGMLCVLLQCSHNFFMPRQILQHYGTAKQKCIIQLHSTNAYLRLALIPC